MGKGDRRTKAKRNQKQFEDAVALAEIPKRRKCGRRREYTESAQDPRKTALDARCRLFGVTPNRKNRSALSGQHNGAQLGMVMEAQVARGDIPGLWAVVQGFAAAERTYRLRYLGQSGTAKGASISMVRERMETDQSHSVDLRSQEERDRDAVNNWMRWRGYLGHLSAAEQTLLHDLDENREGALWDGGPTAKGLATLDAVRRLKKVVDR